MPSQPVSPATLPAQERQCRSKLHQLLSQAEGFLNGSLIVMARRCGKPTCRCASDDEAKHRSLYLGQTLNGKTTMLYIPASLEPSVRQWVANFQQAAQLIEQLSQQARIRLNLSKQQAAARKSSTHTHKAPAPKPPRKPS
jgi:hypothetical protein